MQRLLTLHKYSSTTQSYFARTISLFPKLQNIPPPPGNSSTNPTGSGKKEEPGKGKGPVTWKSLVSKQRDYKVVNRLL
jgi:hypothetical protein